MKKKNTKKTNNKTGDHLSFKITKTYLQKKSLCNCFCQNIERTLPKYHRRLQISHY